ncbi:NAD(P)H-dependent oxidoreductase [Metabacillus flavus]|uniref:NAD(P)H-dependent oxidoreductase n=1 Tax=Metabacillus flavus TaxID=2823519 RepID=UPI00201616FF|nr:NAD(P)H-dependent oxidoreductase [Metabacillus flavus]
MGYDPEEEIYKWQRADAVIFQTPIYWFSIPGLFKHSIDQVYMDNIFLKALTSMDKADSLRRSMICFQLHRMRMKMHLIKKMIF